MRGVNRPLSTGMPHTESVCVAQRRCEIDILDIGVGFRMIEVIQPGGSSEDVWVSSRTNLWSGPAGSCVSTDVPLFR